MVFLKIKRKFAVQVTQIKQNNKNLENQSELGFRIYACPKPVSTFPPGFVRKLPLHKTRRKRRRRYKCNNNKRDQKEIHSSSDSDKNKTHKKLENQSELGFRINACANQVFTFPSGFVRKLPLQPKTQNKKHVLEGNQREERERPKPV